MKIYKDYGIFENADGDKIRVIGTNAEALEEGTRDKATDTLDNAMIFKALGGAI